MAGFFRQNVAAMAGYVPGEQPTGRGVLKLNTNENPLSAVAPRCSRAHGRRSVLRFYP